MKFDEQLMSTKPLHRKNGLIDAENQVVGRLAAKVAETIERQVQTQLHSPWIVETM